jgi:chitin synthase
MAEERLLDGEDLHENLQPLASEEDFGEEGVFDRVYAGRRDSRKLLSDEAQFTHLRYTPVCSERPAAFTEDGYRLRCLAEGGVTIFIVITMYNEHESELKATLTKVAENIAYMGEQWDDDSLWEQVAVCIVSDGRHKANESTLKWADANGIYKQALIQELNDDIGLNATMHLFEFTMQLEAPKRSNLSPLRTIFALKEENKQKLNSHLWFFDGFAAQLDPLYCVLIDVGTQPEKSAIFRLVRALHQNPHYGGVCGEIAVDMSCSKYGFLDPVVCAQNFEYKTSNFMDKTLESLCGFISVLPGAFSAYRYDAIRQNPHDAAETKWPLSEYFGSIEKDLSDIGPFKGNMYLAEDRILCFEVLARKDCAYQMHYVKVSGLQVQ